MLLFVRALFEGVRGSAHDDFGLRRQLVSLRRLLRRNGRVMRLLRVMMSGMRERVLRRAEEQRRGGKKREAGKTAHDGSIQEILRRVIYGAIVTWPGYIVSATQHVPRRFSTGSLFRKAR